jgi:glycosyltransferase XagB
MSNKKDNLDQAIYGLERIFPQYSIRLWIKNNNAFYCYGICFLLLMAIIFPFYTCIILFFILNIIYFISQAFKLFLVILGASQNEEPSKPTEELPIYSILLPVYKEDKVIKNLINAIDKIDYPKQLLDVKLLVEEDDNKTLDTIAKLSLPKYFELIKIPNSYPRTKPKACNYGLQFAKGKYIVVYDAEDRPHPQQLKQAVAKFLSSDSNIICIQARLNFYNKDENHLTKCFAIEYALLFDYILPGLKKLGIPIPLGGTSNHFVKEKLEELGAWDAFNVTEDADLGIRLYNEGYKIGLIPSITLEESPITLKSWMGQRSRWIKGHVLTSLLHISGDKKLHTTEILGLYLFLYIPNLIYLLLPAYLLLWIFINETEQLNLFWQINIILGIILPIGYSIFITSTKKWSNSIKQNLLMIAYYFLLPIAGIRACWQILKDPFYWNKTEHGVSKNYEK